MGIRGCALKSLPFQTLYLHYQDRYSHLAKCCERGIPVVGKLGYGVCDELILAAGMESLVISAEQSFNRETVETYLEYSFTEKGKAYFGRIAGSDRTQIPAYIAFSDSEDVVNRLYYYLRELKRLEPERNVPELYLIDWLFSKHLSYQKWNVEALKRFTSQLEEWSGTTITEENLKKSIELYNRQFSAIESIQKHRRENEPRITGCEFLVVVGAKFFMDKTEYTQCVEELMNEVEDWPVVDGKKIYYCGSSQQDLTVYEAIENMGYVVCGEDHDWGDRNYEAPIRTDIEPYLAIMNHYMLCSPSAAKSLVSERTISLKRQVELTQATAVMFYLDEYDEAGSWDYPSQKTELDEIGVPSCSLIKQEYPVRSGDAIKSELENMEVSGGIS